MFKPRPAQAEILRYRSGRMGVSAVPGSGKTHTLSNLAFQLIHEGHIQEGQEVLVVTLVNSAVDNFAHRIESFLKEAGLLPGMGYRVRTLHGLAHDVVRERPDLVGLSNDFQIIDEREANEILRESSQLWLRSHPEFIQEYGNPNADPYQDHRLQSDWYKLIFDVASSFIRQAKDLQATPAAVQEAYARLEQRYPLIEMGVEIYNNYQRALSYRGAVDFDDLIRLALQAMQTDPTYLARLRQRWPYILEPGPVYSRSRVRRSPERYHRRYPCRRRRNRHHRPARAGSPPTGQEKPFHGRRRPGGWRITRLRSPGQPAGC